MAVRDFIDGAEIDQVLLVRAAERRARRDGADYLRLTLGDRTGAVTAMVWDDVHTLAECLAPGGAARVVGRYTVHPRFGPQINLRGITEAPDGSYELSDLLDGPPRAADQMESDLRELLDTVREPALAALLDRRQPQGRSRKWAEIVVGRDACAGGGARLRLWVSLVRLTLGGSNPALFFRLERTKAAAVFRSGLHCHVPGRTEFKRVPRSSLRSRWSTPAASPLQGDNETWITSFLKSRRPPPVTPSR